MRPRGLLPLPQGKKVNRERLTSLEIGLFPLPEGEKRIPEKEILRGWGVKAGCKMRVPFRPPGEGKGQVHPEGVPPLGAHVLSVLRAQAATFPRQAEGNGHRERRSAGTGVKAEGVGGGKTSPQ